LITYFLMYVSGPLLERSLLRNRRAYDSYAAAIPAFLPIPLKRPSGQPQGSAKLRPR